MVKSKKLEVYSKIFEEKKLFDWEMYIIVILDKYNIDIIPEILYVNDNLIKYKLSDIFSLREILNDKTINFHHLINELLCFFKIFKKNKILHLQLNIDNIYVNKKTLRCYIIDLTNVHFTDKESNLNFQSLYISLLQNNIKKSTLTYMNDQLNIFNILNYNRLLNNK